MAERHFAGVWLGGPGAGLPVSGPVLFIANHTNWWDGFLGVLVARHLGLHFQVLMEAENLDRYPLFRRVGALQMRRHSAPAAYADLMAAAGHLGRSGSGLWIFPQGQRQPARAPIRNCERGAAQLLRQAAGPVRVWPVAFRYAYLGEQLPEAFIWLGEPWAAGVPAGTPREGRRLLTLELERRLQATVDALDNRLLGERLEGFTHLVPGRLSVNKRLDRLRHFLGILKGPFDRRNG